MKTVIHKVPATCVTPTTYIHHYCMNSQMKGWVQILVCLHQVEEDVVYKLGGQRAGERVEGGRQNHPSAGGHCECFPSDRDVE